MLQQQSFYLSGGNTKAFVFNHFFLAVYNVGVTFGVHVADVARVKPAIAQGVGCFFGGFPVALHGLWAANDNLAVLSDGHFSLAGLDIDDFLLGIVDWHTDALYAHKRRITRLGVCERRGLGHAIRLYQLSF